MAVVVFDIPGHLPSRSNERVHWSKRHRISKRQRTQAYYLALSARQKSRIKLPVTVRLIRISARRLDDDNLQGAFKAIRDGIATAFKVSDAPNGPITWQYSQRQGKPARAEVKIEQKNN